MTGGLRLGGPVACPGPGDWQAASGGRRNGKSPVPRRRKIALAPTPMRFHNGTPCFPWPGLPSFGYGRIEIDGRNVQAHKAVYERAVGPVPEGMVLDHLCRNRICVNPDHLEVVTLGENTLRGTSFSAVNSRKTHCVRGHELDSENVRLRPRGERECIACCRLRSRESREMASRKARGGR